MDSYWTGEYGPNLGPQNIKKSIYSFLTGNIKYCDTDLGRLSTYIRIIFEQKQKESLNAEIQYKNSLKYQNKSDDSIDNTMDMNTNGNPGHKEPSTQPNFFNSPFKTTDNDNKKKDKVQTVENKNINKKNSLTVTNPFDVTVWEYLIQTLEHIANDKSDLYLSAIKRLRRDKSDVIRKCKMLYFGLRNDEELSFEECLRYQKIWKQYFLPKIPNITVKHLEILWTIKFKQPIKDTNGVVIAYKDVVTGEIRTIKDEKTTMEMLQKKYFKKQQKNIINQQEVKDNNHETTALTQQGKLITKKNKISKTDYQNISVYYKSKNQEISRLRKLLNVNVATLKNHLKTNMVWEDTMDGLLKDQYIDIVLFFVLHKQGFASHVLPEEDILIDDPPKTCVSDIINLVDSSSKYKNKNKNKKKHKNKDKPNLSYNEYMENYLKKNVKVDITAYPDIKETVIADHKQGKELNALLLSKYWTLWIAKANITGFDSTEEQQRKANELKESVQDYWKFQNELQNIQQYTIGESDSEGEQQSEVKQTINLPNIDKNFNQKEK